MSKKITADWAKKRVNDDEKLFKVKLKKCLKDIKKSANNQKRYCKIERKIDEQIINELTNRGFHVKFYPFFSSAFPIPHTIPAHHYITW